ATHLASGARASNGYEALAEMDANHDGVLNSHDAAYQDLKLWVDANSNGFTDSGELHGLAELGVVSMDLHAHTGTATDNGNLLALVSSYTGADGSTHDMADVWLQRDVQGKAGTQVSVDDVLTAPVASIDLAGVVSNGPADSSSATSSNAASAPATASTNDAVDSTLATAVATAGLLDDPTRHILI
ncbi:MAG: hypothetical protein RJB60_1970, partial [Pseudomonadota bacterium]